MTTVASRPVGGMADRLVGLWNEFWFKPTSTATLALVRIAFGGVLLAWCVFMSFDLLAFFSDSGILPERVAYPWTWSLLEVFSSDIALVALFGLLVVAAICIIVGYHTRLASLVAFVVLLSFERRNLLVLNAADILLRLFALYLALAPAGAALSVDRWRHHRDRFWEFPARAPWALRLVQVQISVLYLFTVWLKLQGSPGTRGPPCRTPCASSRSPASTFPPGSTRRRWSRTWPPTARSPSRRPWPCSSGTAGPGPGSSPVGWPCTCPSWPPSWSACSR